VKVVVTGAGGAVGSYVVKQLAEMECEVIAIDLPHVPVSKREQVQHYPMDLTKASEDLLRAIINGADGIIHTAAIVDISKSLEELWPLNVDVVDTLATIAAEQEDCKFVHISSGSVYKSSEYPIDESYDRKYCPTPYEFSKTVSEDTLELIRSCFSLDFRYTILRPALIYGPKARFLGATLATIPSVLSMLGQAGIGFTGGPITNWVHAEDVARASVHCLLNKETDNLVFNVADNTPLSFGDTITDYLESGGFKISRRIPLPSIQILRRFKSIISRDISFDLVNFPLQFVWKLISMRHGISSPLTVKVDKEVTPYMFDNTVFNNKALRRTNFKYKHPNSKLAIPAVMNWYRREKWIP
jgi:nucleoside-diphosphate-sugar epimerase